MIISNGIMQDSLEFKNTNHYLGLIIIFEWKGCTFILWSGRIAQKGN